MKFIGIWLLILVPFIEIWGYFKLGSLYGWWYFLYMVVVGVLGWRMIKEEKSQLLFRMMNSFQSAGSPFQMIMGTAKNMIAGGLFLFPGIVTDLIAIILLVMPSKNSNDNLFQEMQNRFNQKKQKDDSVIEGEFKKEDDD